jgi:hypothetical protein
MTVYLRWLIARVLVILPWLLLLAAITIFLKPNSESLHISAQHFGVSLIALAVLGLFFVVWVLWRSLEISG